MVAEYLIEEAEMDMKRYLVLFSVLAALVGGFTFMAKNQKNHLNEQAAVPLVSVSTFSLYEAAHAVAGNTIDIEVVVPLGSDPHLFSPNPALVAKISKGTLFVYNGAGFETWAETMRESLPKSVQAVDMSRFVKLSKNEKHGHDEHGGEEHDHGEFDPHYWLDIDNMVTMTRKFEELFSTMMPEKAPMFHANAANYITQLESLKNDYKMGLAECKNRTLISNHDAFGYLARANNLEEVSVIGLSTDEQPSAKVVADVVEKVKEHGMKTIFFEELVNDNVSQTIARESGAKAVALQPLENISEDELKSHQTYLSIMRENLKKLREAMECR